MIDAPDKNPFWPGTINRISWAFLNLINQATLRISSPELAKMWCAVTQAAGTYTLQDSFNVASITKNGTGDVKVTLKYPFTTANWAAIGSMNAAGAFSFYIYGQTKSEVNILMFNVAGAAADANFSIAGFGTFS